MNRPKRFFYGWVIVGAAMIIAAFAMGLVNNIFGIFIVPVCADMGFSRASMSITQTVFSVGQMVIALFTGKIFRKYNMKRIMLLAAIVMCAGYFSFSLARNVWMFYIAAAFLSVCIGLLTWVPLSIIICNWFYKKRGFTIGLAFTGSGIGGMIFSAVGGVLLEKIGWRNTFFVFGAFMTVVLLPTVIFILKIKPSDVGQTAYGEGEQTDGKQLSLTGAYIGDALKTPRFYGMCLCIALISVSLNTLNSTMVPQIQSYHPATFAALMNSVYMACLAGGKLALGWMFDAFGTRKASAIAMISDTLALVCMAMARFTPAVFALTLLGGFGNSFGSVSYQFLARECYGDVDYAAITGVFVACSGLGSAIGPTIAGTTFDACGSYNPALWGMAILVACAGAVIVIITKRDKVAKQ